MNLHNLLGLISILISAGTLCGMLWGKKHTVKRDYVADLESELKRVKEDLRDCKARVTHLENQVEVLEREKVALLELLAKRP